jgi:hypothetical protein
MLTDYKVHARSGALRQRIASPRGVLDVVSDQNITAGGLTRVSARTATCPCAPGVCREL